MVAKAEKDGGDAAESYQSWRRRGFNNKPSWLLCTIADLDERMKILSTKVSCSSESFSAMANSYYNERPQLLELLHDIYNGYLSLADRYCQALTKGHRDHGSRGSSPPAAGDHLDESDNESTLSFQNCHQKADLDMVVTELVLKMVDCDIVADEVSAMENTCDESSRKVELQKTLLDVLESERLILLNDNATLGYRVAALVEENKGLASESLFLKRKTAELATCVVKTTENYRVCVLSKKIEELQGQIHGLEKRNKEYYERKRMKEVRLEECFHGGGGGWGIWKWLRSEVEDDRRRRRGVKLWEKVKRLDYVFVCGTQFSGKKERF